MVLYGKCYGMVIGTVYGFYMLLYCKGYSMPYCRVWYMVLYGKSYGMVFGTVYGLVYVTVL